MGFLLQDDGTFRHTDIKINEAKSKGVRKKPSSQGGTSRGENSRGTKRRKAKLSESTKQNPREGPSQDPPRDPPQENPSSREIFDPVRDALMSQRRPES